MNSKKLNTVLLGVICFLVLITLLIDISINISWSASITDWLSVIVYFCTLCAAIIAALIAHKALSENRSIAVDTRRMADDNAELVRQQTQPFIDIKLEIMPQSIHWVRLKITNVGLSSAINIHFRFENIPSNDEQITEAVIQKYKSIRFMTDGLNYLSKEESRYTNFINLIESDEERGFSVEEFLNTSFKVIISFQDLAQRTYENLFLLSMNELEGYYAVGFNKNKKLTKQLEKIQGNIELLSLEYKKFNNTYEKNHMDYWTELELKRKLNTFEKNRNIARALGVEENKLNQKIYKNISKRPSIQELRKMNR